MFQRAFGAADEFSHSLLGDLVYVTGAFDIHGMVSTPPVAAGWWSIELVPDVAIHALGLKRGVHGLYAGAVLVSDTWPRGV